MLPVSSEVLLEELRSAEQIIAKWVKLVEEGVPGVDVPCAGNIERKYAEWFTLLRGELRLVTHKCGNIVDTLSDVS